MKCGPISRGSIRDLIYLIFGAASATGPTTERGFITRWDVDPESGPVPGLEVYNFLPRTPWHILGPSRGMVVPASKKREKKRTRIRRQRGSRSGPPKPHHQVSDRLVLGCLAEEFLNSGWYSSAAAVADILNPIWLMRWWCTVRWVSWELNELDWVRRVEFFRHDSWIEKYWLNLMLFESE